eukprot:GEZU01014776.1.p1 GENE.GEZU01014776.1~~GEZU01014776.1.p1  ORF type:complete len:798 (-),score=239.01 GEZU01014776.1:108-2501(-)
MRIYIKGGPWKNTEDEILKAAVMKYGKNQWSRIASLLNRKSAKQCKARWYEWLDPSIKKTEWTREEEEKLLHLAKLFPTQWKTIAPIVGRTASQCLEHYEKLLDQAQEKTGEFDPSQDPRRLRPGEIDPNPETKPARPDAVDMDEDEKEMLSEARARLANTKGKKAKRKAREKQLEEARRLAALQKRRELKAAGIEIPARRRKVKGVDYNAEIPFEKKPAPGFFDTSSEKVDSDAQAKEFINVSLHRLESRKRSEVEEEQRRIDIKKQRQKERNNLPEAVMQINKLNDPAQVRKRTRFSLPAPQVSDAELEEIAKMGNAAESAKNTQSSSGSKATQKLLADYKATPAPTPLRTPRTPAATDTILLEAQNLAALTTQSTPLVGGANTPLNQTFGDFGGITPRKTVQATPNPLATPMRTPGAIGATPRGGATPAIRDELHINDEGSVAEINKRAEKQRQAMLRNDLRKSLSSIPEPKNEYQVAVPEIPEEAEEEESEEGLVEDAADMIARGESARKAKEQEMLRKRSQPVQRDLPRPIAVDRNTVGAMDRTEIDTLEQCSEKQADELIKAEMLDMIQLDAVAYPYTLQYPLDRNAAVKRSKRKPTLEEFSDQQLQGARDLVAAELANIEKPNSYDEFAACWEEMHKEVMYLPSENKYIRYSSAQRAQKIDNLQYNHKIAREHMAHETKKVTKLENKLNILTGGYKKRSHDLRQALDDLHMQIDQARIELHCFKAMQAHENNNAIPLRIGVLQADVQEQKRKEKILQDRYVSLTNQIEQMTKLLASSAADSAQAVAPMEM